jgi:hypothetical protein
MDTFILENPNKKLVVYGIVLFTLSFLAFVLNASNVFKTIAVISRILAVLWIPIICATTGRNKKSWTAFGFFLPSFASVFLGIIGHKKTQILTEAEEHCKNIFQQKHYELSSQFNSGQISREKMNNELALINKELNDYVKQKVAGPEAKLNETFLNKELERQGYIISGEPEKTVVFSDKCTACGATITIDNQECPDCGLALN